MTPDATNGPAWKGRAMILAAAVLWNTSGVFARFLGEPTVLHLDDPRLAPSKSRRRERRGRSPCSNRCRIPWVYLASLERERPTVHILLGGTCILGALAYRYWPGQPEPTT